MKNLLITGGCGFIGSNYINYIFNKYDDVNITNIDAMYYCASENNVDQDVRNSERYRLIKGNLCSYDLVYDIITNYSIEYIIHFAAQSHVQNSFEDALQYTKDNILGTHNLLEAVRKYGKIKKFIHVSTDEVYGESMIETNESKKTEESILCPTNPYAATKASAELIAQSYYYSFNIPIIITRGNNVYGPNQYPEKIIPKFIKLLNENKKVTIQGDGSNVRAFIHVYDVVKAFDIILEKGIIGEIYNIGSDDNEEYTVKEVAEMLIRKVKKSENYEEYIEYITDRPFNDKRYYISNEKIKNLGWEIVENFDEGIDHLIKEDSE
jgi:dTDP-glucose 4,6-dehydratase